MKLGAKTWAAAASEATAFLEAAVPAADTSAAATSEAEESHDDAQDVQGHKCELCYYVKNEDSDDDWTMPRLSPREFKRSSQQ